MSTDVTRSYTVPSSQSTPPRPLRPDDLILETERLHLRPLALEDADLSIEIFTDPDVMRYVWDVMTPSEVETSMANHILRGAGGRIGVWSATDRSTGEKLGTGALLPMPIDDEDTNWDDLKSERYPEAEIEVGYFLKKSAWGKGYATEICKRLLAFAFEQTDLPEIVATTDNGNAASQHVLTKCGFQLKGRRYCYAEDDCPDFRITREEWLTRQQP